MKRFSPALFAALTRNLETLARTLRDDSGPLHEDLISNVEAIAPFQQECVELGLTASAVSIRRLLQAYSEKPCQEGTIRALSIEVQGRLIDEMLERLFFSLDISEAKHYLFHWEGWEEVLAEFPSTMTDVEEARKCLALGRYTAAVFHLMRVTEAVVLRLQCFLDKPDPKAHFGSVLDKLEKLHTKTRFEELPEHLKPHRQFLIDILAQLHAVKDSWRNKVSHVDDRIIVADVFTEEMALGIYSATLLLMKKLAKGLGKIADSPKTISD